MKQDVKVTGTANWVSPTGKPSEVSVTITRAQIEAAWKEINEPEPITLLTEEFVGRDIPLSSGMTVRMEKRDLSYVKKEVTRTKLYLGPPPVGYEWVLAPTEVSGARSRELFIQKAGASR